MTRGRLIRRSARPMANRRNEFPLASSKCFAPASDSQAKVDWKWINGSTDHGTTDHKLLVSLRKAVATETGAVILFWLSLRFRVAASVAAGVALAVTVAVAEPPTGGSFGEGVLSSRPQSVRRYEVREDAETGRLVRVPTRVKASSEASRRAGQASSKPVVQGESGPPGRVQVRALVEQTARRHDVDPKLVHAVIRQESDYDPFAVSSKGAMGLMQLMPDTADRFGVQNIFDPAENVRGGVLYLRHLLDRYNGDPSLTLAAYNAGEGAVDRYGDVPPYRETVDYVSKVRRLYGLPVDSVSNAQQDDGEAAPTRPRILRRVDPSGIVRYETE